MSALSKALLIIAVISAGIMHGHFQWSGGLDPNNNDDSFIRFIENLSNKNAARFGNSTGGLPDDEKDEEVGNSKDSIEQEDDADLSDWEDTTNNNDDEEPLYKPLLDDADLYIARAAEKLVHANRDLQKRRQHAQKAFEYTDEALNILDALCNSYPDNQDILERLQQTYKIRHDAMKIAPRDK